MELSMDTTTREAFCTIVDLLEKAYRRYSAVRRVPGQITVDSVNKELESQCGQSVHVCG